MKDTEEAALAVLESTPAVLRELIGRLPEAITTAELDRGWSPKKFLAHIVDVEQPAFAERLRRIVNEDQPGLPSIDPMARLEAADWTSKSTGALLGELERTRAETCRWIIGLTGEQLQRTGRHDTAGEITASNLLHYWAYHDLAHIRHVQRMVQSVLGHELGNTREDMDV